MNGSRAQEEQLLAHLMRRLREDTLRYIPSAVIPAALSIAGISVFTRVFDPLDYGRYAVVVAVTLIAASLLSGWIQQSVLRYLPRFNAEGRVDEFLVKLLHMIAVVSGTVLVLCFIVFPFMRDRLGAYVHYYHAGVLLVVSEMVFSTLNAAYQAGLKSKESTVFKSASAVLRLALALLFIFFVRRDVIGILLGAACANFLLFFPMLKGLGIAGGAKSLATSFDTGLMRTFAAFGIPMIGWMMCGQLLGLSDRVLIGAFRGSAEAGIYAANYNLVTMGFGLISTPLLTASYPLIMNAWESGDRSKITQVISQFTKYYVIAVVPVVVFTVLFSRELVTILLGSKFREGYTIIPFVTGGVMVWGVSMIGHKGLEIQERTRTLLMLVAISMLVNLSLNLIMIPAFGYQGAAVTTLIGYCIYPILVFRATRTSIGWLIPWRSIVKTACAGIAMGAVMSAGRFYAGGHLPPVGMLCAAGVIGIACYASLLAAMRELTFRRGWR